MLSFWHERGSLNTAMDIVRCMPSLGEELTNRLRYSRFGRDIFGPKIAGPAARWLDANFPDETRSLAEPCDGEPSTESSAESAALPPVETATARVAADVDTADDADEAFGAIDLTPTSPKALLGLLQELGKQVKNHNLVVVAAGIAFFGVCLPSQPPCSASSRSRVSCSTQTPSRNRSKTISQVFPKKRRPSLVSSSKAFLGVAPVA